MKTLMFFYKKCYHLFNPTVLNFLSGLISGVAVSIYMGSDQHTYLNYAVECLSASVIIAILMSIVQNNIQTKFNQTMEVNRDLRPDQMKQTYAAIEDIALKANRSYKVVYPIMTILLLVSIFFGMKYYRDGRNYLSQHVAKPDTTVITQLRVIAAKQDSLAGQLKRFHQAMPAAKPPVIKKAVVKKQP